jgi:predicted acyltransferase
MVSLPTRGVGYGIRNSNRNGQHMTEQPEAAMLTNAAAAGPPKTTDRLVSLDTLRGFDMFWIMGGQGLVYAAATLTSWKWLTWCADRMEHPQWNGFEPWDLIFPLFLFIAGVSTPISIENRLAKGDSRSTLYRHIVQRGLMLVFLGVVYNGLLTMDWSDPAAWASLRYPSVLGRIGLAYMFAALIAMNTQLRGRLLWIAGLLIGYWAALRFIPVPGFGAWDLSPGHTLTDYIDHLVLPGQLYHGDRDPEGLLATIPAIATALFGVITGQLLKRTDWSGYRKTLLMVCGGCLCLSLAWLWNRDFPINKNLWSSSFVLHCAGWSLLLLSLFYLVIDVWRFRFGTLFFIVIGANSILIYMAPDFIDFNHLTRSVFGGALSLTGSFQPLLFVVATILFKWMMLYLCYRKRIFLKV